MPCLVDCAVLLCQADALDHKEVEGQLSAPSVDLRVLGLRYQVRYAAAHDL